ncbi:hypothetical protein Leryth_008810 [Lithospermum erythrorhizon]|nr:hypothetical protein Leryth_008810 [Lithospermum erythrorhizon]
MDPNPNNFPILSYVMSKLPSMGPRRVAEDDFDIEQPPVSSPKPQEPHFELSERMPHLTDPKVVSAMRTAVADVSKARSAVLAIGERPDHETVDIAKAKVSELTAYLEQLALLPPAVGKDAATKTAEDEMQTYKAVVELDKMHMSYDRMLREAEHRLEKIYEAAVAGGDLGVLEEGDQEVAEELNEDVERIMGETASGKLMDRVDLPEKQLRMLPEAFFTTLTSVLVLNLSNNLLKAVPDSISGLEKLEELDLSSNLLESLPDSIGLLFNLKSLNVSRNKLVALPDSICHCRSLVELDAGFNQLAYLPTNIGYELVNLRKLSINLNKLRSLPTSIGEMKSLQLLDAHFNELRGLPLTIGKLINLEVLNLASNFSDLSELPYTIGDLISLKELDLSNNQIHELPDSFSHLENLTKLNLDLNPLAIPPKEVVSEGVEAVKAYMVKRRLDLLMEEERKRTSEEETQQSLLTRSTSWLNKAVTNVSGYLSSPKSKTDPYLDQQF